MTLYGSKAHVVSPRVVLRSVGLSHVLCMQIAARTSTHCFNVGFLYHCTTARRSNGRHYEAIRSRSQSVRPSVRITPSRVLPYIIRTGI